MSDRNIGVYILFKADTASAKAGAAEVRDAVSGVTTATEAQGKASARTAEARKAESRAARDLAAAEREAREAALKAVTGSNARWNAAAAPGPRAVGPNVPVPLVLPGAAAPVQSLEQAMRSAAAGVSVFGATTATIGPTMAGAMGAVTGLTRGLRDQTGELVESHRETMAYQTALDGLRARFNPLFAVSQAYEAELRDIAEAERLGALTALEAAAARDRAAQAMAPIPGQMGAMGDGLRQTGHYAGQLTYQLNDIGMMMAAGQNPFMLMMQQGPQVSQVFGDMRNQGLKLGPAIAGAFGAMLNPVNLATMAVIGGGAALVQWMSSGTEATKTLDAAMGDLSTRVGSYQRAAREAAQSNEDLAARVGSASAEARILLQDMEAMEKSQALRAAGAAFRALQDEMGLGRSFAQNRLTKMFGMPAADENGLTEAQPVVMAMSAFDAALSERDPEVRLKRMSAAMADMVEQTRKAVDFDGKRTADEEKLLTTLTEQNLKLAEQVALRDGSAKAAAIAAQVGELAQGYEQQAELTRVIALHGEQSAEAEAVRTRHLREGLEVQLARIGADPKGDDAVRARAGLEARIAAETDARVKARQKTEAEVFADLTRQEAVSRAILQFGENSSEVEALRAMHAREVYKARLLEQGILGPLADQAVRLMEAEQDRQRTIRAMSDGRTADGKLASLREERAINQAILAHGESSLRVRELQIAAERRLYEESLATLQVTEARKKELMAEWELTHGLKSADPFGRVAANRDALRSHQERMDRLQLELRLVGTTNAMREKALAMQEAEVEARKVGGDVAEWRDRAAAMADLTREVQRQTEAWDRARQAAEGMIDGPVDALLKGDLKGALESFGQELLGLWSELALKNPLKNRLLGTDYATMDDIGGLSGFFGRLFGGQPVLPTAETQARAVTTAAMTVTTPMVTISTSGLSGLPLGAGLMPAANSPLPPGVAAVAGPSMAAASL